ncbi:MAG TPA: DUF6036 family nucleotidyltransferase [Humisphaera sp.]
MLAGMERSELDEAIHRLCARFQWHCPVEVLMVGGAAGMLTGVLPRDRVTTDCDIIKYLPDAAAARIELVADDIGREMGLPDRWLNSDIALRTDLIPDGWEDRRQLVDRGDFLHVYAVSRVDLVAMKFFARRPQDLEDLEALGVGPDDIEFTRRYLSGLTAKGTPPAEVAEALDLLNSWTG